MVWPLEIAFGEPSPGEHQRNHGPSDQSGGQGPGTGLAQDGPERRSGGTCDDIGMEEAQAQCPAAVYRAGQQQS